MSLSGEDNKPYSTLSMQNEEPKHFTKVERPVIKQYVSKTPEFDLRVLRKLENYQEREYHYGNYFGQIVNEKKHGIGKDINLSFKSIGLLVENVGRVCEGNWQNDRKHGYCLEIMDNGDQFEGEYLNGKAQGFGVYTGGAERFEGNWVNGFKHGQGRWENQKGEFYDGDWKFGKIDGTGTYVNKSGDKYTGSFRSNLKHGRGIEHFSNGDVYNGEYVNGKMEGEGMYLWENGQEYRGRYFDVFVSICQGSLRTD